MAVLRRIPRPEGGAERDFYIVWHHNCPMAKALRPIEGDSIDELVLPVGLVGWEMPLGVAFEVQSVEPCGACGTYVRGWFEWTGQRIYVP